jgi:ribosome-associated toxin RatA of RatAB toxin-antitoxin module
MKIKVKRIINAPKSDLWEYLGDYANIHRFHPMLKDSYFIQGSTTNEVGSVRQCDMKNGDYLKERITDWEEGTKYTITVEETSMPFDNSRATLALRELGPGQTEATMEIYLEPKNRILQPMAYVSFRYKVGPAILKGLDDLYQKEHQLAVV